MIWESWRVMSHDRVTSHSPRGGFSFSLVRFGLFGPLGAGFLASYGTVVLSAMSLFATTLCSQERFFRLHTLFGVIQQLSCFQAGLGLGQVALCGATGQVQSGAKQANEKKQAFKQPVELHYLKRLQEMKCNTSSSKAQSDASTSEKDYYSGSPFAKNMKFEILLNWQRRVFYLKAEHFGATRFIAWK